MNLVNFEPADSKPLDALKGWWDFDDIFSRKSYEFRHRKSALEERAHTHSARTHPEAENLSARVAFGRLSGNRVFDVYIHVYIYIHGFPHFSHL